MTEKFPMKGHCYCGHEYYDHNVSMNTNQDGRCRKCDCINPELPSEDALWEENEKLQAELTELRDFVRSLGRFRNGDLIGKMYEHDEAFVIFNHNYEIAATGTDALDAWEKLKGE